MSDNLPPDFRDDTREHYPRCASLCEHSEWQPQPDHALAIVTDLAKDVSFWSPPFLSDGCIRVQNDLNAFLDCIECPLGHESHDCNCEDIASSGDPWDTADMVD